MRPRLWTLAVAGIALGVALAGADDAGAAPVAEPADNTTDEAAADKDVVYAYQPGGPLWKKWFIRQKLRQFMEDLDAFYQDAKGAGNHTEQVRKVVGKFFPGRLTSLWKGLYQKYPNTQRARLAGILNDCTPKDDNALCNAEVLRVLGEQDGMVASKVFNAVTMGQWAVEPFIDEAELAQRQKLLKEGNAYFEALGGEDGSKVPTKAQKGHALLRAVTKFAECLEIDVHDIFCGAALADAILHRQEPAGPSMHEVHDMLLILNHVEQSCGGGLKDNVAHEFRLTILDLLVKAHELVGNTDLACKHLDERILIHGDGLAPIELRRKLKDCNARLEAMQDEL